MRQNQQTNHSNTEEKLNLLLLIFGRYVMFPAILICGLVTFIYPPLRVTLYNGLGKGMFTFLVLLTLFGLVSYYKGKK